MKATLGSAATAANSPIGVLPLTWNAKRLKPCAGFCFFKMESFEWRTLNVEQRT